jgi:uncharacterized protein (TIGR02147 family)
MPDIFSYLDYRKFLLDLYAERKAKARYFSYRYLAQKTGLKSVGFFTWVLQGKRNLSPRLVLKFAEAFKLNKQETGYFELLVSYNQARSHEEKKHYFDKIASQKRATAKVVDPDQYEFYAKWYYSALREALGVQPFKDDFARLGKSLIPPISATEAKRSVELLEKLGLIEKDDEGRYHRKDSTLTTGENWRSLAVTHFQLQSLDLARQAMDRFSKTERDISTLTLSCSAETFARIREKLKGWRQELAELVKNDPRPEGVYQLNFQAFPLSRNLLAPPAREAVGREGAGRPAPVDGTPGTEPTP